MFSFWDDIYCRENVEFCGYNVPHPLEDSILIRLQTKNGVDAVDLFFESLQNLQYIFASIRQKFEKAISDFHSS